MKLLRLRIRFGAIAIAIIALGLIWRFGDLPIPAEFRKYGGSMLWASMVYFLVLVVSPTLKPFHAGLIVVVLALIVEFSRLWPNPTLDAFRLTLAGQLILGRVFSWWNIAAYEAAIFASCALHALARARKPD